MYKRQSYYHYPIEYLQLSMKKAWESYLEDDCLLQPDQLQRLSQHKYNSLDASWLDELCMKRFWNYLIEFCPLWVHPNLLSVIGLIINLVTVIVLAIYSSNEQAPSWTFLLAAVGLFLYQTLDALDGKQARRTKCASPLGELFDHGCDSMTQVFVTLNLCYSMQLWQDRYLILFVVAFAIVLFYCAHWSTYCTGQLRFSRFDVTEAQMAIICLLIATAVFGPDFWSLKIFGLYLKYYLLFPCLVISLKQIFLYIGIAFTEGAGKNGSTVANSSVLFPIIPLICVILPFYYIYSRADSSVYDDNITLFSLCFGAIATKMTNRLIIIGYMSRSELNLWDWIYMAPTVILLNQYYGPLVDERLLLIFATMYSYANLLLYCFVICRQLCDYLNINCFSLKPRFQALQLKHN
ncbi:unnamed protein product [Dracunculus medinensis]|uniref:diacylglycerol cholinephosphotransferase n=1 Tax=Dracunculus medinensis TaxID=318479 RepID=A0A0N4U6Z3_DRAME|nr:unnamed protein product [Dracunculus medinensis]